MKLLKEIGLNISEEEYRNMDLLSYSYLSNLDRRGPGLVNEETEITDALLHGTLVDEKISGDFKMTDYHVSTNTSIGDGARLVVDSLFDRLLSMPEPDKIVDTIESYRAELINVLETQDIDYYKKKAADWVADKVLKDNVCKVYFSDLVKSRGKTIITLPVLQNADKNYNTLITDVFTKGLFDNTVVPGVDKMYQFKYKFKIKDHVFKGMLDLVIIDHNTKTIEPYDLKTGSKSAREFGNSFFYWRYDLQAYIYNKICEEIRDKYFPGYTIATFKFIYIGRFENKPLIWEVPKNFLPEVYNGYIRNNRTYKGVAELIDDYDWYVSQNFRVDYPKVIYDNNGIVEINVFNIIFNGDDKNREKQE